MEQKILTNGQKLVLETVSGEPRLKYFYLSGGTALTAFYLYHRLSDDLDFFSFDEADSVFLYEFAEKLKKTLGATGFRFERLNNRNQFFFDLNGGELKVEFTRYPFHQLEKPNQLEGILVDSLRDIAANKLATVLDRFDPKDFVDLYFLLREIDISEIRADVQEKFGYKVSTIFLAGELAKVRRIEALPKILKPITVRELKDFFADLIKKLSPEVFG